MSTFNHGWYWTPKYCCRQGKRMREATTSRGIMLSSRREWRTKALEENGESDRLQMQTRWNWRDHAGLCHSTSHTTWIHHVWVWHKEILKPRRLSTLILISCIITFIQNFLIRKLKEFSRWNAAANKSS